MSWLSKTLKGSFKNNFRGGSMWKLFAEKQGDKVNNKVKDMLGLGALEDMAATQEQQLMQLREQNKLNASNEVSNVTKFEDASSSGMFTGSDSRQRKRAAGAYSSGLGLGV